jgi:signal transduction histidine kinase
MLERRGLAAGLLSLSAILFLCVEWVWRISLPSLLWLALVALAALALVALPHRAKASMPQQSGEDSAAQSPRDPSAAQVAWNGEERRRSQLILAAASHELRTPINAVVGFAELLRDAERNNAGRKTREDYAAIILENARVLQARLNEVLDANRLEAGTMQLSEQNCDLAEIIEVVTRDHHAVATERGANIIARIAGGIACRGDGNRLRQALSCIVDNAVKFSPADGIVNINMLRGANGQLVISITDAGIGMTADDIDRVFHPFRQLDEGAARHHAGLGLGLFIARGILHLHGGDVTISSSAEAGTDVRLVLPANRIDWRAAQQSDSDVVVAKRVA